MCSDDVIIDVRNLSKCYEIYAKPRDRLKQLVLPMLYRILGRVSRLFGLKVSEDSPKYFHEFWALHNVTFQVRKGETLGIVGRNGSGKSTLLQLICGTTNPTTGHVQVTGRISALLELGSGFNPEYTGRENIFLNGQILGLSQKEIESRYEDIVRFADIGDFVDQPVKIYSSGMVVRLAFAVAIHVDPGILVIDEALSVGDIAFQRKCLAWLEDFQAGGGTLLFVSHSSDQVRKLCSNALYLQKGEVLAFGAAKYICDVYEKDTSQATWAVTGKTNTPALSVVDSTELNTANLKLNVSLPECATDYGDGRARVVSAWLEGLDGIQRSNFHTGERMIWKYVVQFIDSVNEVAFGLMLKTKEGVNLFSANSETLNSISYSFNKNSIVIIQFEIDSHLGAGQYFVNCGVSSSEAGEMVYLHRILDAGIVSITPIDGSQSGLINMAAAMSYKDITSEFVQST